MAEAPTSASTGSTDKLATEQLQRYEELRSERDARFMDDWQHISSYALPQESDIQVEKTEGVSGWTDRIFDTTMIQAVQTLSAGMYGMWTPPNQPWAEFDVPDEMKSDKPDEDSTIWLGKASDKFMRELQRSNFYAVKGTGDLGLAAFATDLIIFDESDAGKELFNFIGPKIGTYVIEENYKGIVDTMRRTFKMTWRQIEQKFSKSSDAIPEKMKMQAKGGKAKGKKFEIVHCIFPREDSDRLPGRKDGANKPFASVYIAKDFSECIRVSGYDENPILCRRFAKWGTDAVWGYGPSYLALPDARQVNYVQQFLDARAEVHVYPRVLVPDNLEGDVDLRAGGVTTWDTSVPDGKPEEWALGGTDYELGLKMQDGRRQAIRDAFFVDAFKLLNSQPLLDKEMTAYEVSQRQAEQLQGVAPSFTRTVSEFINPIMKRGFGIMFRNAKLGKAPVSMMKKIGNNKVGLREPEVVVTSRFNDALRALKNRGTEETFGFIAKLPGPDQHPEYLDPFNMMAVIKGYAENTGMPPDNYAPATGPLSAAAKAQARAQIIQQQRAVQLAEQVSKAGKNLGGAPQWAQDQAQDQLQPKNKAA